MKTISLRTLVRELLKVKCMTRAGKSVLVMDYGEPLWILQPAEGTEAGEERLRREIEEELKEVLRGPRSKIPLSKIVLESRRCLSDFRPGAGCSGPGGRLESYRQRGRITL
jgi:hypothetical protein